MSGISTFSVNQKKEPAGSNTPLPPATSYSIDINPEFIVEARMILRAQGPYSYGNPITWEILTRNTAHGFTFFTGFDSSDVRMRVLYPNVRTVLNSQVNDDESGSANILFLGPSTRLNAMIIDATIARMIGTRLIADGAGNWSNANPFMNGYISASAFGAAGVGETGVNLIGTVYNFDTDEIPVVYQGAANFTINRRYAALGPYLIVFSMRDATTGAVLAVNPAAGESVILPPFGQIGDLVRTDIWYTNNSFMASGSFNMWISATFEAWMVARNNGPGSAVIKWQPFPGAVTYSLSRDNIQIFLSDTALTYTDNTLNAGQVYEYELDYFDAFNVLHRITEFTIVGQ